VGKRLSPREQRTRRRERSERAFLFDSELNLVAEFERQDWESALSSCGGDPVRETPGAFVRRRRYCYRRYLDDGPAFPFPDAPWRAMSHPEIVRESR
jgi:hypothetical protein